MWRNAKIRHFLWLGFFLRLWLEKLAERRLRIAHDNQDFLFWATLAFFLFRLVSHDLDGKLYLSLLGFEKVRRTGLEPVRLDSVTRLQVGPVYQFPAPAHKGAEYGGEGSANSQLASAWFGHLSNALNLFSLFLALRSITQFRISTDKPNNAVQKLALAFSDACGKLNVRPGHTGNRLTFKVWRQYIALLRLSASTCPPRVLAFRRRVNFLGLLCSLWFRSATARLSDVLRNLNSRIFKRIHIKPRRLCDHLPLGNSCVAKFPFQIRQSTGLQIELRADYRIVSVADYLNHLIFVFRFAHAGGLHNSAKLISNVLVFIYKAEEAERAHKSTKRTPRNVMQ